MLLYSRLIISLYNTFHNTVNMIWQIYVHAEALWNMSKTADVNDANHTLKKAVFAIKS